MTVHPVLLGVTIATVLGIGCMLLVERRNARPRPPYPTGDDWNWEWDDDNDD